MSEAKESADKRTSLAIWLFNPFLRVAGFPAMGIGLAAIAGTSWVGSLTNTHFDGVLDAHTAPSEAPYWIYLAEGLINWLSLSVVLLGMGLLVSRGRFRVIDLLGTQALARWPMLLGATALLLPGYGRFTEAMLNALRQGKMDPASLFGGAASADTAMFATAMIILLASLIWFVALAWKSFRISCDTRGGKAAALFIAGVIAAEILSKVAICAMLGAAM